jgi:hypothetical protein
MLQKTQRGATALFIVIFSTLLLSVITISFVGMINRDKVQSNDNELSQGAYDAALAGVEDAKRVVAACLVDSASPACTALANDRCSTVYDANIGLGTNGETLLKSSNESGVDINQAYTCVKVSLNSNDVLTELPRGKSYMTPIRAVGAVRYIEVKWQQNGDSGGLSDPLNGGHDGLCGLGQLCNLEDWGNIPTLLRVQLITPGSAVNLSTLDDSNQGATFFLYPNMTVSSLPSISQDGTYRYTHNNSSDGLKEVVCSNSQFRSGYACTARIQLSSDIPANSELNFVRITPLYTGAAIQVSLLGASNNPVLFRGVQPVVDSTGRANDIFRRVEARLSTLTDMVLPEAAVDMTDGGSSGNLCKHFYVTASTSGAEGTCTP